MSHATITTHSGFLTVMNVFHTSAANQQKLLEALNGATERLFSKQPGFITASFHRSHDGTKVANYAQWRSLADYEAFLANPEVRAAMGPIVALRASLDHGTYEVVSVHAPAARPERS